MPDLLEEAKRLSATFPGTWNGRANLEYGIPGTRSWALKAEKVLAELVERLEQLQAYVERISWIDPSLGPIDAHALVKDAKVLAAHQRGVEGG